MLMTYVRPTVRQQREEQARTQTALVEAESWRTELNSLASRLGFVLDELGAPTMQGNGQFGLSLEGRIRQLAAPTNPEATLRMLEAVVGPEKDDSILCYRKSVELEIAREADGCLSYLEIGYTGGEPDNKVRSRAEALAQYIIERDGILNELHPYAGKYPGTSIAWHKERDRLALDAAVRD